jgi:hypothetical protein
MTKIQTVISELKAKHQKELDSFQTIHNAYMRDRKTNQEKFNSEGLKVMEILRHYEKILCGKQERSDMAKFSSSLSEKYWVEIKKDFPLIDFVGVKIN